MTQISFHVNVSEVLPYACRLLRKAYRLGARVLVTGPGLELHQLDQLLWTFDPLEFVPHSVWVPGVESDELLKRIEATPVWLCEQLPQPHLAASVVLNLGDEPVMGLDQFEKLIDIVAATELKRESGRRRWKHYVSAGYSPLKHDAQD